ncbi:hypothetical protein [Mycolicibacterium wolinskyi]|uniref:hypothetical protein n=1 Tax=Mycolicibacterium wolinskyi TaxID=59750 RepID=UPI003917AFB0
MKTILRVRFWRTTMSPVTSAPAVAAGNSARRGVTCVTVGTDFRQAVVNISADKRHRAGYPTDL